MSTLSKPRIIDLEITNLCQADCSFCPREKISRPLGKMSHTTLQEIIPKLQALDPYVINISGMGECLLHNGLNTFLKEIKSSIPCALGITTNGLLLDSKHSKDLLKIPDFITISYNGDEQVLQNIKKTAALSKNISTPLHLTTLKNLKPQQLKELCQNTGVQGIISQQLHNRGGYLKEDMPHRSFNSPCQIFNNSLFITWEGKVLSCCHDLEGKNSLGDLTKTSLQKILEYRQKKIKIINPFPICHKCNDALRKNYFAKARFYSCKK